MKLSSAPAGPVRTALSAWASRPGIVRAGWPAMVALGIVLTLVTQILLVRREVLDVGDTLTVTALAIIAGAIGAKAWYVVLKRRERRWDGWCIQGFVLAVILVALVVVPLVDLPLGTFLDLTTPPLFLGMGTGRIGCLLAGCCGGRPTCSRVGIWSSDRRLGARRVPTQLLEAGLGFTVAAGSLAVFTWQSRDGAPGGLLFVAALAGYTLCRQGLLRFRAEGRRTSVGSRLTGITAGIVFVAAGAALVLA
ncbi:MAG: prolipoprotein diacylglyceryl transferase [Actinomycetota bacterium]|nr:prolipoprotein diacylglyceryl transferase [Actinomycetota bacterium]